MLHGAILIPLLLLASLAACNKAPCESLDEARKSKTLHEMVRDRDQLALRCKLDAGADVNARATIEVDKKTYSNCTPLLIAIVRGDAAMMRELVGRSARASGNDAGALLVDAAKRGDAAAAQLLLEGGADVNATDRQRRTPLHEAAARGDRALTKELLQRGAAVDARDIMEKPPIYDAINLGHAEVCRELISKINLGEAVYLSGQTPLMWASCCRKTGIVKLLIDGSKVNAKDSYGTTALHCAATNQDLETARLLVQGGADVNITGHHYTVLGCAVYNPSHTPRPDIAMARFLLDSGAEVNPYGDRGGESPLHLAVRGRNPEIVELLLVRGARINAKNHDGQTPLHYAPWDGTDGIAALLVSKGADLRTKDGRGRTPLHIAAHYGMGEMTRLFTAKGAPVNSGDSEGNTPLHYAVKSDIWSEGWPGRKTTIECLIDGGARVNMKNNSGETPLEIAAKRKRDDLETLLKERGAR